MKVTVDGQVFNVPDDATIDEIDAISHPQAHPSVGASMFEGAGQGASLGWKDEMVAGWKALAKRMLPQSLGGTDLPMGEQYKQDVGAERAYAHAAEKENPKAYMGAQLAGGMVPTMLPGGASLPAALAMGGLAGAGGSEAKDAGQLARDAGLGVGVGALGYGAGQAVSKALSGVGRYAGAQARLAQSRATGKAADEVAAEIASARGALGGEVQKGNRLVENLRRLGPDLSPEEQQIVSELEQRLVASNRGSLPGQAATIATKDAELSSLQQGASQALKERTADLLSTDEVKRQTMARLLRYGPVALGSAAGHAIGGPVGGAVGALAGAGTRPMIQSMRRLAKNPAVQNAAWGSVESAAPGTAEWIKRLLMSGATGPAEELALAP